MYRATLGNIGNRGVEVVFKLKEIDMRKEHLTEIIDRNPTALVLYLGSSPVLPDPDVGLFFGEILRLKGGTYSTDYGIISKSCYRISTGCEWEIHEMSLAKKRWVELDPKTLKPLHQPIYNTSFK